MYIIKLLTVIMLILLLSSCIAEESKKDQKPTNWENTAHGVTFSLKQLSSDQVDAFYIGRGFTKEQIQPYTKTCVYTAILRNDKASGRIHFIRSDWKAKNKDHQQAIKQNSEWLSLFKKSKVAVPALIAFRLAQIPEEQEYDPNGDWNQGMLSINMPLDSYFDLTITWDIKEKPYQLQLKEVHCAK